jgi:hypothetical protein
LFAPRESPADPAFHGAGEAGPLAEQEAGDHDDERVLVRHARVSEAFEQTDHKEGRGVGSELDGRQRCVILHARSQQRAQLKRVKAPHG